MVHKEAITLTVIMQYLGDVDYPTSKEELIEHALDNGAPPTAVNILTQLPSREYAHSSEVEEMIEEQW